MDSRSNESKEKNTLSRLTSCLARIYYNILSGILRQFEREALPLSVCMYTWITTVCVCGDINAQDEFAKSQFGVFFIRVYFG